MTHITVDLQQKLEAEIQRVRDDARIDPTLAAWRVGALEWVLHEAGVGRLPPGYVSQTPERPVLAHPSRRYTDRQTLLSSPPVPAVRASGAQDGIRHADEVKHGSHQAIVGGTDRTNDDPVSSSVRPSEHAGFQQRPDHEADGASGLPNDGVVVEQGEGGRSREVSDVRAQTPSEQGNRLAAVRASGEPQK